jgi:serine/threonine protein kinase
MRRCETCGGVFDEEVDRCPVDGTALEVRRERAGTAGPTRALSPSSTKPAPKRDEKESPLLGRRLDTGAMVGEYEVTSLLEEGGMGTIYAAVHPVIGKQVAIKVLAALLSQDESMTQRFIQEARAVNQIQHDNIVDIFGFGRLPDARLYYVMELLSGQSLKARRKQPPPLRYEEALSILAQICDALAAAHAQGIIHRDLKPDNIFLVEGKGLRTVKLLDFGIAKLIRREQVDDRNRTEAGLLMGTPQYMSPEQCLSKEVDARTDIYSLGVIMFELFTGRVPFLGKTAIEVINGHLHEPPPVPRELLPSIPTDLNDVVLSCLEKDVDKRPASIAALRERLLEISITEALGLGGTLPAAIAAAEPSLSPSSHTPASQSPATPTAVVSAPPPARRGLPAGLRGAAIVVVLAFAAFGAWMAIDRLRGDRANVVAPAEASLQVLSEPPGASVILDGRAQALLTPYVFKVPAAPRIQVRLELAGYVPHEETVTFSAGEKEKALRVVLAPVAGAPDGGAVSPGDAGPRKAEGSAPAIADLRLRPTVAWIGERTTISGELTFQDADGDVKAVMTQREAASASGSRPQRIRLTVAGATRGTAAFTFVVSPRTAEPHVLEIWVVDTAGHASNRLKATIEALAKEPAPDGGTAAPKPAADAGP